MGTQRGASTTRMAHWWVKIRDRGSEPVSLERELERLRPPTARNLLPWLSMGIAPLTDLLDGRYRLPWLAGLGLVGFAGLFGACVICYLRPGGRDSPVPRRLLAALTALTCAESAGYGHNWLLMLIVVSLAHGAIARGRHFGLRLIALSGTAGVLAGWHGRDFWGSASIGYFTLISGLVSAAVFTLHEVIVKLRTAQQELARSAVAQERLRFSRDLHDLLGHTLSVVVVKAEAVRRLAPRDLDAALGQVADIESVGRQALTEVREAVTGYREVSLATELARARSALDASGVTVVVHESGPPLPPQAEALMGWVVREGVTNVVRHSRATRCEIALRATAQRARLEITDNGDGATGGALAAYGTVGGCGLKGLTERLSLAGGSLTAGPAPRRGFRLAAELPVEAWQDHRAA